MTPWRWNRRNPSASTRPVERRAPVYNGRAMPLVDAIRALNHLKQRGVIRDYVVFGVVAATVYMEPVLTQDLDINVLV